MKGILEFDTLLVLFTLVIRYTVVLLRYIAQNIGYSGLYNTLVLPLSSTHSICSTKGLSSLLSGNRACNSMLRWRVRSLTSDGRYDTKTIDTTDTDTDTNGIDTEY